MVIFVIVIGGDDDFFDSDKLLQEGVLGGERGLGTINEATVHDRLYQSLPVREKDFPPFRPVTWFYLSICASPLDIEREP